MSNPIDMRVTAYRDGVAAASLRDAHIPEAKFFVDGQRVRVRVPFLFLRKEPDEFSEPVSMLNLNEWAWVYPHHSSKDGWTMAQCEHDNYVGFARAEDFFPFEERPPLMTHRVVVHSALVYTSPSDRFPTGLRLGLWTEVHVARLHNGFSEIPEVGWVKEEMLLPLHHGFFTEREEPFAGPAMAAEKMKGVPYVWAARNTTLGVDCSGMVQLALHACGIVAPRDSDMQMLLGDEEKVPRQGELGPWTESWLLFWEGHVAVSRGRGYIIHASGTAGRVVTEWYDGVVDERGLPIAARKVV